jgi:hypothetical protein
MGHAAHHGRQPDKVQQELEGIFMARALQRCARHSVYQPVPFSNQFTSQIKIAIFLVLSPAHMVETAQTSTKLQRLHQTLLNH